MKIVSDKRNAAGARRVTAEITDAEKLLVIRKDSHYKLGQPVEDVVASHVITDAEEVVWRSASQKWEA